MSMSVKKKVLISCGAVVLAAAVFISAILVTGGGLNGVLSVFMPTISPVGVDSTEPAESEAASRSPDHSGDASESAYATVQPLYTKGEGTHMVSAGLKAADFYAAGDTAEAVKGKLIALMSGYVDYHIDTIMLSVNSGGKVLFSTGTLAPLADGIDLLALALAAAHDSGLRLMAVWDVTTDDTPTDLSNDAQLTSAVSVAGDLAKYNLDGVYLGGLSLKPEQCAYDQYLAGGGGMGFELYRQNRLAAAVRALTARIADEKSSITVGLVAPPVWAVNSLQESGVKLPATVPQSLRDGAADTLGWLEAGYFNAVQVESYTAISDGTLPFKTVADWWIANVPSSTALLFGHAASKVGMAAGYKNPDELVSELRYIASKSINGFVFDSFSALRKDATGSTSALQKYLNGEIPDSQQFKDLTVTSPNRTSVTVNQSTVLITGGSDPLFPISLDGQELERNTVGGFSVTKDLKLGDNKFVLSHKGKTVTYSVFYKLVILREVAPTGSTKLSGGSVLDVIANARTGSKVTCTLGKTTINLVEQATPSEGSAQSEFVSFVGSFTLPGATGKDQSIGTLSFKATHSGQTETKSGAKITVGKGNAVDVGKGLIAEVTMFEAETLNAGGASDAYSRVPNNFLPKGTVDYCSAATTPTSGVLDGIRSRVWRFGRRVVEYSESKYGKTTYTKNYNGTLPDTNTVTLNNMSTDGRHTKLVLDVNWKAPFKVDYAPQAYPNNTATKRDYTISGTTATFDHIDITFCYAAQGQGKIEFGDKSVFSGSEWVKSGSDYVLRLKLRKAGSFYGWLAEYNAKGQLEFWFLNPVKGATADSLGGVKVVLDPGHDGVMVGASGNKLQEHVTVLLLAEAVQSRLQAKGAEVVMTRTGHATYSSLVQRKEFTKRERPNLFLSIHRNAAGSSGVSGLENYYFYPWAKAFGEALRRSELSFWPADRGTKWAAFTVMTQTYSPSVLTEEGFISNTGDSQRMIGDNIGKNADVIVAGMVNYLKAQ